MSATTLQVTLPEMGESITEGTVSKWLKNVGDRVSQGEGLVEVTTDKVDAEVPAPASGRLLAIIAKAGDTVTVGAPLAEIEVGADGDGAAPAPVAAEAVPASPASEAAAASPEPAAPVMLAPTPAVNATEGAELLARARGIDLAMVRGSGEGGQIRRSDVARAVDERERPAAAPAATPPAASASPVVPAVASASPVTAAAGPPPAPAQAPTGSIPLRGAPASLVKHMEESLQVPTATSFRTIRVDVLDLRRRQLNQGIQAQGRPEKLSYTHLVAWAIIRALRDVASMAVVFDRVDGVPTRVAKGVHLGLAVDVQRVDGSRMLVVPVIHDADRLDFTAFRDQYETLVARARTGKLSADDLAGATIVITNPGGIGTMASVPRLMRGQGTIIATGAIGYPPEFGGMADGGLRQLGVSKLMTLTSTYDHRVIQGAESGEFLGRIDDILSGADSFYESVFAAMRVPFPTSANAAAAPLQAGEAAPAATPTAEAEMLRAVAAGTALVSAYRSHGHLAARLDPLGSAPPGDPSLDPLNHGLTPALAEAVPAVVLRVRVPGENLAEVLVHLRETYCSTIAYEIEHISSHEQRNWLRETIESGRYRQPLSPERKLQLLGRLTKVETMERYLRRAFLGQKTFSIEGLDSMIVMLEEALQLLADDGTRQVVMGMAHRGRLSVIAHVVNRPYASILVEFEAAKERGLLEGDATGDVKYHAEAEGTYVTPSGKQVSVSLLANPSHLEAVDPVVEGWTRAQQSRRKGAVLHLDQVATVPILIHGDASFAGQGVVAEVFNLDELAGYSTGGTLHVIADNQLGFTTDPDEGRSTRYASDLAKGFDVPIIHVNADDITACVAAVRLAVAFRKKFARDVLIDLIGYRRFGHNEADEPAYTQPLMYAAIKDHPPVRELFTAQLIEEGLLTAEEAQQRAAAAMDRLASAHEKVKARAAHAPEVAQRSMETTPEADIKTAVSADTLESLNRQLYSVPDGFTVHPKLVKQMERRKAPLKDREIDWAQTEDLAFASLITGGIAVRLTGQDTERGTFSQRHMVFHDPQTGARWAPIQHLVGASATFELHNSPLSEYAALGFEYGYSAQAPDALIAWEAQYGDFTNGAQIIVDQFIVSGLAKWGQSSRLTLLLPHGYEGSGPEHSSARLERFLELAAEGNIRVAYPTTAAQYFHVLRREALHSRPRPLILMTPKSLLRLRASHSRLEELTTGGFKRLIDDPQVGNREAVRRLILCTGKIYYELAGNPERAQVQDLAIARLELLEPLRVDDVLGMIRSYPNLRQMTWVQEEPMNMGGWAHVQRRLEPRLPDTISLRYVGRPERASPSEGYAGAHQAQQERIVHTALAGSG